MRYWLMKSEPDEFSIDDLQRAPNQTAAWYGVRNYRARNFMRDEMAVGDGVFFYHSSCPVPGIAGIAAVASSAYPDESQFDPASPYYEPRATRTSPRWVNVDLKLVKKTRFVPLAELRAQRSLGGMRVLQRANRLSITPVAPAEWEFITNVLMKG
jgi:predicted RNA-binding protein with PUA-like domain